MLKTISGILITLAIGGVAGYLYYRFIGCRTGGCPITSNVWSVVVFGAVVGYLLLFPVWEKYMKSKAPAPETHKEDIHESNPEKTR